MLVKSGSLGLNVSSLSQVYARIYETHQKLVSVKATPINLQHNLKRGSHLPASVLLAERPRTLNGEEFLEFLVLFAMRVD
jgi:hypothetical protein